MPVVIELGGLRQGNRSQVLGDSGLRKKRQKEKRIKQ